MPTRMTCASFFFALAIGISPNAAQAGSLCNWLFGGKCSQPAYPVGGPVPLGVNPGTVQGFAPGYPAMAPGAAAPQYSAAYGNFGSYFGSGQPVMGPQGAGYPAVPPGGITAATLPAQPMSFVPNFNSSALRAPVTYYRPVMTTDPNTGAQVVAMMPCTSYQYMTQRVPAFGRTSLFGSYQPPAPPSVPAAIPSYTLPSGGIPLAQSGFPTSLPGNSISSPAIGFGTATGFGGYSTGVASPSTITAYAPATSHPGAIVSGQGYSVAPPTSSSYYGSVGGGSTGTIYSAPVPGLMALPVPQSSVPTLPPQMNTAPSPFSSPSLPPTGSLPTSPSTAYPSMPSNTYNQVLPPSDPADSRPSLPENGMRPQLRSIYPENEVANPYSNTEPSTQNNPSKASEASNNDFPVMSPIPAPEGLRKPSWNPGLLREGDMTALRPITRADQYAGHSKKIVWASFESESSDVTSSIAVKDEAVNDEAVNDWAVQLQPSEPDVKSSATPARSQYDNTGWRASR